MDAGLTRVAQFALHLEPVSQLSAAEKPYLSLIFAWVGLRAAAPPSAAAGAAGDARAPRRRKPHPTRARRRRPSAAAGGGVRRPGDWTCPGCHAHNFASRSVCFKCKNPKAGGGAGGAQGGPSFGSAPAARRLGVQGSGARERRRRELPPGRLDLRRVPRAQLRVQERVLQVQAAQGGQRARGGGDGRRSGAAAPDNFRSGRLDVQ